MVQGDTLNKCSSEATKHFRAQEDKSEAPATQHPREGRGRVGRLSIRHESWCRDTAANNCFQRCLQVCVDVKAQVKVYFL